MCVYVCVWCESVCVCGVCVCAVCMYCVCGVCVCVYNYIYIYIHYITYLVMVYWQHNACAVLLLLLFIRFYMCVPTVLFYFLQQRLSLVYN